MAASRVTRRKAFWSVNKALSHVASPRVLMALILAVGIPIVLSLSAFVDETPIRAGEPSPRTVIAPAMIRVEDEIATERARREAREKVSPVLVEVPEARAQIVAEVRDDFGAVAAVRRSAAEPGPRMAGLPASPSTEEQLAALRPHLPELDTPGLRTLVTVSDSTLERVRNETVDIAQQLARQRILPDDLDRVVDNQLQIELAVRNLGDRVAAQVVRPLIRDALRPTIRVDEPATEQARDEAADEVSPAAKLYNPGSPIVTAGESVGPVQLKALQQAGLAGSDPPLELLRGLVVVLVGLAVVSVYLRTYRPRIWGSTRRLLLLTTLFFGYALLLGAVHVAIGRTSVWLYAVPAGALAMLTAVLLDARVGALMGVPMVLLTAFVAPDLPGVVAFVAAATLISVPSVSRLSARGDLRRGTLLSAAGYVILAGALASVFGGLDQLPRAAIAGAIHGLSSAVIVLGGLPFLESAFGIVTTTSLVDLADRNHPLLRELEREALGSYNHSIQVATLVERACRAIGADALLASVAALYHDVGKVRRPYFFVENQFGVPNPHDSLAPEISAYIIHEHVRDGIQVADTYHLPPEVVEGIATHHGTTLVTYFYLEALRRAQPGAQVDEATFRYKGRKPSSKETAVLMLADCCEAAARAAAQNDRNLTRAQLHDLVEALLADRVDDGQLDDSPLTFRDLTVVKESFIETLVGIYHPRIVYADRPQPAELPAAADGAAEVVAVPLDSAAVSGKQTDPGNIWESETGIDDEHTSPVVPQLGSSRQPGDTASDGASGSASSDGRTRRDHSGHHPRVTRRGQAPGQRS